MARTITQIEQIIDAQVDAESELAQINTTSQTGVYALIKRLVARTWQQLEFYFDAYMAEIKLVASRAVVGTNNWMADKALEFQYGDPVVVINGTPTYAVIDATKKIVKYSSCVDVVIAGVMITQIKAAKSVANLPVKLTTEELASFTSYINAIKFAGTRTQTISIDADLVKIKADVYYDGNLVLADVKTQTEAAILAYLQGINYDGVFNLNKLRDAMEGVTGIKPGGVDIDYVQCKPAVGTYVNVDRVYAPASGYYKIDPAFPLSNTAQLNYIAQ